MKFAVPAILACALLLQGTGTQSAARDRRERAWKASNLGVARLEQFDYDAAATEFREALRIDPAFAAAELNLAIALYYGGHVDTAQKSARAAADALPGAPQPPYMLGLIAKALNQEAEAAAAFKRVADMDPADAGSRVNLGQVDMQLRKYDEAVALFKEAIALEPYNATAAYGLAQALIRNGQEDAGRAQTQRFQQLRDSAYAVTYAQGYLQQGRYAEAIVSTGAEPELVDTATPAVTFVDATRRDPAAAPDIVNFTLFDVDGDGDEDILEVSASALRLRRNDAGRFTDATAASGLDRLTLPGDGIGAVAGDYDNDGRPDLLVLRSGGVYLLHQKNDGKFEDVTSAAKIPDGLRCRSAAFVDADHDGDLDIVIAGSGAPSRLLRNNGNGTFTDITDAAGLGGVSGLGVALVPTDFDNRRDIDLLVAYADRAPALFQNMRDGTFRDVASRAGLSGDGYGAVAAGDINKDGFTDFVFARRGRACVFALSDGKGGFAISDAPPETADASAVMLLDYDNDGLLDLLTAGNGSAHLLRNLGTRWVDVTKDAALPALPSRVQLHVEVADVDGDGDSDILMLAEGDENVRVWRNDGAEKHPAVRVRLAPRVSNRGAAGAKVELRAGSLREKLETSSATPAVAPADLLFGLGQRAAADSVRVIWPSGILQTELAKPSMTIEELDRKPSSCPFLYTWNGSGFEFVTDFLGGGEMGDWVGPGEFNIPDPDEYVRVRGDQLRARDGRYELRVTNELEEAMFLDRVQLVAVDHRRDVEVYPNEGLRSPPRPPFQLYATRGAHPPLSVREDPIVRTPVRGYAAPHALTLDIGPADNRAILLLTGWTEYAWSSDNVAAAQAGLPMQPPYAQVRDASGAWKTVIDDIGFPVGRPQTVVVDFTGRFPGPSRDVRIVTTMPIHWERILVDTSAPAEAPRITRAEAASADLHWRGFSAELTTEGRPARYDYSRVSADSPWKAIPGRYTRYGDVKPLLRATDDMFAIAGPGDEISLSFDVSAFPPVPAGQARTFLLYADGFSKEMNIRSATPDTLGPLPFHAMRRYPYGPDEMYPATAAHRDYLDRYNTRVMTAPVPSLDRSAASVQR
jgi:tetratricopeptide (TPR) repeat protein